jgi:two-component sensor histidine kinase
MTVRAPRVLDHETEHRVKNQLAIVLGYCNLLLAETPADDPRHVDVLEMQRAATAMLAIFNATSDG